MSDTETGKKTTAVNDDQDATVGTAPAKPKTDAEPAKTTAKGDGAKPKTR